MLSSKWKFEKIRNIFSRKYLINFSFYYGFFREIDFSYRSILLLFTRDPFHQLFHTYPKCVSLFKLRIHVYQLLKFQEDTSSSKAWFLGPTTPHFIPHPKLSWPPGLYYFSHKITPLWHIHKLICTFVAQNNLKQTFF